MSFQRCVSWARWGAVPTASSTDQPRGRRLAKLRRARASKYNAHGVQQTSRRQLQNVLFTIKWYGSISNKDLIHQIELERIQMQVWTVSGMSRRFFSPNDYSLQTFLAAATVIAAQCKQRQPNVNGCVRVRERRRRRWIDQIATRSC